MLEVRPYRLHISSLFGLGLLSTVFALVTPLPLKIAVDSVVGSRPPPSFISALLPASVEDSQTGVLLVAAGLFVLIALLKQLQEFASLVLSTYTGEKLLLHFRSRLFRHAERLSLAYHDSTGTADSAYRIQYDAMAIQTIAVTGLIPFFTAAATIAGMIYVTAQIDWQLALVSVAVAPVLFLVMWLYRRRLRAQWHDAKRLESSALSVVQESLEALRVVKAFGREDHARDRFADRSAAGMRAKIDLSFVEGRFGIVIGATIGVGMGTVLFLGTRRVLAGAMTLGDLVLVMGYLQQLYDPLQTAAKKAGSLQSSLASADRVYSLLGQPPDVVDDPDARPLTQAAGAVSFRDVSFGYDSSRRVLHDVSFAVEPGTRLGIAGATGAGKTTLLSLMTRFYEPSGGEILLDGVDVRRYRLADLRNQFSIVLQEPVLFSATIGENIAYARPGASHADVVAAAKGASVHDFIQKLPDGYDSPVGERGVCLSGGERQRISLARAFLKDAPILILDEPTSSVDARTERDILDAMERLMTGRTAFMIAHRESTLEICDARLDLDDGRVVATTLRNSVRAGGRRKRLPVPCEDANHPAVRAWQTTAPVAARIDRVDRLRAKEKLEIYRLGIAGGKTSIIAKRRRTEDLVLERTIYESVLPQLPHPMLRCFGSASDDNPEFAWLFLEDGGDSRCSLAEHGQLAARWLGTLHGAAGALEVVPSLPARGPGYFLGQLRGGRSTMVDCLDNETLRADDQELLAALIATCDRIESQWAAVEAACRGLPQTLLHGDVEARNLRVRHDEAGPAVVAFDWGWSGFGVPAVDVYQLALHATRTDLSAYRATIASFGGGLDEDALRGLVLVGMGFRLLSCVDWVAPHLRFTRPQRATTTLRCYDKPLREWADRLAMPRWSREER
jgi:ATP-binding cassette subfamily B protein